MWLRVPRSCLRAVTATFGGALLVAAVVAPPARAQYLFGQNKVVYGAKDWKILSTPRLDVYYYHGEDQLAEVLAAFAEEVCVEYEAYFRHKFEEKIPLILYASHHDFKQTNVIDMLISDYVGGFTESIRGRVAIPHTGSMTQLRNVTRHELVHAFMNDKMTKVMTTKRRYNYAGPPLWFSEGMAEYVALRRPDTEARMFMRDLVVNDNLVELPDMWRIHGSFLMYKEGESLVGYIANRFGDEAIAQLLDNWWMSDRFDRVLRATLGIDIETLNRDWKRWLKRRWYPTVLENEWPDQHGIALTHGGLNTRPAPYTATARDSGACDFVFLSARAGSVDLMYARARSDSLLHPNQPAYEFETLVRGGRSDRVESIPPFSSGPEIHGHRVAFTTKSGASDALVVWDLEAKAEVDRFAFDDLTVLGSPTWSPDGESIAFTGLDHRGWPDVYRVRVADGALDRLTYDPADDRDPDWSHDGTRLVWSSDRDARGRDGVYHLWMLDLASAHATCVTSGAFDDGAPSWSEDDTQVLFTSDRNGQSNVYLLDVASRQMTRLTATLGGLFNPQWLPGSESFVASSFSNVSYNVYRFDVGRRWPVDAEPEPEVVAEVAPPPAVTTVTGGVPGDWLRTSALQRFQRRDYRVQFGLDFVRTAVAYDPDFMNATGGQLGFTDMLGNHQMFVHVSNSADDFDAFWRHLNLGFTYTNLENRLNYSLGAFHLSSVYDPSLDIYRYERRTGILGGLQYPLSRFRRLETMLVARTSEREFDSRGTSVLVSTFGAFVHDNTIWSMAGPTEGMRFNTTLGHTFDVTGKGRGGTSAQIDLRRYVPLPMRTVFAARAVGRANWGPDLGFFFLGGSFDMRGYSRRELFGRRMAMLNGELRFPLVDRLLIGLPFDNIEIGGFRGALFHDAAYVGFPTEAWFGSLGAGVEMVLGGGFILRWDMGRTHDFEQFDDSNFSRFFLGWDY